MNIYKHEFKTKIRSVIIWSVSIAAVIFVYMGAFSAIAVDAEQIELLLQNFPPQFLMAFGMDNLNLSSVLGFFGVAFTFAQICLAIQAANYGLSMVSIEENELTADFLLAKPVKRTTILTSKLLAAFIALTITNVVAWISSFCIVEIVRDGKEYDVKALVLALASIVVFQLFFLTLGLLISLLVKRMRSVTPYSMALAFGMYILTAFGGMLGDKSLEIISPFTHFDPNFILGNVNYDWPLVAISVGVILVSVVGSYILYDRRNIASAA